MNDKAYIVNKYIRDYNADCRNRYKYEQERKYHKSKNDVKIKALFFCAVSLFVMVITATCLTMYIMGKEPSTLIRTRSYASLEQNENRINENELGVGGMCAPDSLTTPYTSLNYYIKSGDSIHSIAKRFGVDECTLIKLNNIDIPSKIVRGQKLQIPNQNGISEEVTRKNSLDKIAKKYNVEKEELMRINNICEEDNIDKVFVPGVEFDGVSKKLLLGEYFRRPAYGRFTSMFGYRPDPFTKQKAFHTGVDIANKQNTPIYAAAPGKIVFVGNGGGYGNLIKIQHTSGYVSYYGHLHKFGAKVGQWVSAGQLVGYMGTTGYSTGNHLHYEIRHNNVPVNPMTVTVF